MTEARRKRGRPPGSSTPMAAHPLTGLRAIRIEVGMTQEEVGALIGINKAHYGKFENGVNRLDVFRAKVIADYLGIKIDDFFE